jgi:diguanylate cyclase (GGDEF)-like protein
MNNLKYINDNMGHLEGDKALVTLGDVLLESEKKKARFYRVGGDEFVVICLNMDEDKVKELIKTIQKNMKKTKYTCSIGYEMKNNNSDLFDVYKKADEKMYKEKELFHSKEGRK